MQQEFLGRPKKISPELLVGGSSLELDSFFLVIALIYNDLKGLVFFGEALRPYRPPAKDELSGHAGEFNGLAVQRYKLTASLISEFLLFLEKNVDLLNSAPFLQVQTACHPETKKRWAELVDLATLNKIPGGTSYVSSLARIRNNVGFHYDHSMTELKRGFERFFGDPENPDRTRDAYFSYGTSMQDTRFYYADAAVQGYMTLRAQDLLEDPEEMFSLFNEYSEQINKIIRAMNETLGETLMIFIEMRRNGRI